MRQAQALAEPQYQTSIQLTRWQSVAYDDSLVGVYFRCCEVESTDEDVCRMVSSLVLQVDVRTAVDCWCRIAQLLKGASLRLESAADYPNAHSKFGCIRQGILHTKRFRYRCVVKSEAQPHYITVNLWGYSQGPGS